MEQEEFFRIIFNHVNRGDILDRLMNDRYLILFEDLVPEHFWEPVKVKLPDNVLQSMKEVHEKNECIICSEHKEIFKEVPCCKHKMCKDCTLTWFHESVYCPYCKKDIRKTI